MRDPETESPRTIYIKRELWEMIRNGRKIIELRVGFPSFKKIKPGDTITFDCSGGTIDVEVTAVRSYKTLNQVFESEDISKIVPGIPRDEAVRIAQRLFRQDQIDQHGFVAIEFKKI